MNVLHYKNFVLKKTMTSPVSFSFLTSSLKHFSEMVILSETLELDSRFALNGVDRGITFIMYWTERANALIKPTNVTLNNPCCIQSSLIAQTLK